MKILALYAHYNTPFKINERSDYFKKYPFLFEEKWSKMKDETTLQQSITGYYLLQKIILQFNLSLSLNDLFFDENNRPHFKNTSFDFNISHSQDFCVCIGTEKGKVGVDLEAIKPVQLTQFKDYFEPQKWEKIIQQATPILAFYEAWTKEEAAFKLAVTPKFSHTQLLEDNYCLTIVSNVEENEIQLLKI